MALFESYERRMPQIEVVLKKYGMKTLDDAKALCASKGIDPYTTCKGIQAICFENAAWAYVLGAAIAIKKNCAKAADAAEEALAEHRDVVLNVRQENAPAISVYERLGYRSHATFIEGPALRRAPWERITNIWRKQ